MARDKEMNRRQMIGSTLSGMSVLSFGGGISLLADDDDNILDSILAEHGDDPDEFYYRKMGECAKKTGHAFFSRLHGGKWHVELASIDGPYREIDLGCVDFPPRDTKNIAANLNHLAVEGKSFDIAEWYGELEIDDAV